MEDKGRIRKILSLLRKAYGRPRALKRSGPVDELIRTVLSQNTSDTNSLGAFASMKRQFASWEKVREAPVRAIEKTIQHAGLARIKAGRIKGILGEIRRREGAIDLSLLEKADVASALAYLKSFKGVGPKTAACVLLFSFGKPVMPVDTHIFRVARRVGLISAKAGIEEAHDILSKTVPPRLIYEFHLGIIEHGRRTCKALHPRCGSCVLYGLCEFEKKAIYKGIGL